MDVEKRIISGVTLVYLVSKLGQGCQSCLKHLSCNVCVPVESPRVVSAQVKGQPLLFSVVLVLLKNHEARSKSVLWLDQTLRS